MKPCIVYQSERATVVHGDGLDALALVAIESVDLVVTDPPYGVDHQSNRRAEKVAKINGDTAADRGMVAATLAECVRVVGQNRHLYVFGPTDVMAGLKVASVVECTWDKGTMSGGDTSLPYGRTTEPVTFAVSKYRHAGEVGRLGVPGRLRKDSVLRYMRPTGRKQRHPNEKPVPLLRELIESSSRQGELVADPFCGVGSTGVAAILTGRRVLLIDNDRRWLDGPDGAVARVRAAEQHHDAGRWL